MKVFKLSITFLFEITENNQKILYQIESGPSKLVLHPIGQKKSECFRLKRFPTQYLF